MSKTASMMIHAAVRAAISGKTFNADDFRAPRRPRATTSVRSASAGSARPPVAPVPPPAEPRQSAGDASGGGRLSSLDDVLTPLEARLGQRFGVDLNEMAVRKLVREERDKRAAAAAPALLRRFESSTGGAVSKGLAVMLEAEELGMSVGAMLAAKRTAESRKPVLAPANVFNGYRER